MPSIYGGASELPAAVPKLFVRLMVAIVITGIEALVYLIVAVT